jgi:hypothetical protein
LNKLFGDKNGKFTERYSWGGLGWGGSLPYKRLKGLQWIGPYASWTIKLKM